MFQLESMPHGVRVAVNGEIDIATAAGLDDAIALAGSGNERVILSLDRCTYLDSSCLTVIYRARKALGDRLWIVVDPASHVRRIFRIAGVEAYLRIVATMADVPVDASV